MHIDHLVVETEPAVEDIGFLEDRLHAYNVEQIGVDDGQWLAIFVRDAQQTIHAGIEGWTWCGSCHIRTFWVHQDLRGQGIGTKLLHAAEQEATARGCQQITLASAIFQAPGFYQKQGYDVVAVLEDFPSLHTSYCLRKRLT